MEKFIIFVTKYSSMTKDAKEHRLNLRLDEEAYNFLNDDAGKESISLNALVCRYIYDRMTDTGADAETDKHVADLLESTCTTLTTQGADSRAIRDLMEIADILKNRQQ